MDSARFLKNFFLHPLSTGAVAASSRRLAELITDTAQLDDARVVVEFGTGTGVFTEATLRKLPPGAEFFALEINPDFVAATRTRCPGARVIQDSAANAAVHLRQASLDGCDRIISGLPWASFPDALQDQLLDSICEVLHPGGRFVTFAYSHGLALPSARSFHRKLQARFSTLTTTRTVWLNLPPAFVYCAVR